MSNRSEEIQREIERLKKVEANPQNISAEEGYQFRKKEIELLEAELKGIQETEARILEIIENVLNEENTDIQTFDCDCGGNIPDINKIKQELTSKIKGEKE